MDGVARSVPWVVAAMVALLGAGAPHASGATGPVGPPANPGAVLAQLAQDVGGRGATARLPRYAYLAKLDSHLQDVAVSRLGAGSQAAAVASATRQGVTTSAGGEVAVDVYVNGGMAAAADALRALGMRVTAISDEAPQRMVEGFLPPAALPQAAALSSTHAVLAPLAALNVGSVTSQGVATTHANLAQASGATGAGVTVGVISDSINQVPANGGIAASGTNLPANTVALSDDPGGTDEGRAMAEIAYDEAPGIAGILFATADGGPSAKAAAIDSLVSHGAKVIADDTSYITEPFFQDDVVAQAVDRAKAAGTAYFAAAGNDAQESWQGTYSGTTTEDFDPGPAVDTVQTVGMLPSGTSTTIVLQWAEPWGAAVTDLALDIYSISGTTSTLLGTADTNNLVTGIPEEAATITNSGSSTMTYGIAIRRVAGVASPLMKFIDFTNGAGTVAIEHPANAGAISPDAASADGALTVAASAYSTPTTPEAFSSRGPVTHYFDANSVPLATPEVLQKPELAAPDGVSTSLGHPFAPFYGTSAATPAAAGIAALILSANPGITVDELYAIMTNPANALACAPTPLDCGAGFVLADRALGMARDSTPPVVTPTVAPAAPDGANGWYRGPVNVTWAVSDGESPVTNVTGCAGASPADGTTTLTCSATSAGGTTTVPIIIKRDSTPPAAPVIAGVAARTYSPSSLPAPASLKCAASDPVSGIASCTISGYSAAVGHHTLTAVAIDAAGLSTTTTVAYAVAEPPAISQLKLPKGLTLAKLARSGARLSVHVAAPGTRLSVTLAARVGRRTIALGHSAKRASQGTISLRVTLTAAARRRMAAAAKATLEVAITGTSASGKRTKLHGSLVARRA